MRKLIAAGFATLLIAGCAGQSRDNPYRDFVNEGDAEREYYRHGNAGYEIAEIFSTGKVADARRDMTGVSHGIQASEFYMIEIAENPNRPSILTQVGFIRKLEDDRSDLAYYEFYDEAWNRIAYQSTNGQLYRYDRGSEIYVGRFQLAGAVQALFPAGTGYGYDSLLQDRSIVNTQDPAVALADPAARGVAHTTHSQAPAVVIFTPYRAGEARQLADRYERQRFYEREAELKASLEADQGASTDLDNDYGNDTGWEWRDGNPYDPETGKPILPHSRGR